MHEHEQCQVCKSNDWKILATRHFLKSDIDSLNNFNKHIFRFMFDVWFPGESDIEFKNLYCNNCGLICFSPRPTVDDLERLRKSSSQPKVGYCDGIDREISRRRSQYLYDYLAKYHNMNDVGPILDYGGMDGILMEAFVAHGKECFLVDYCPTTIPGVTKICDTVYDLTKDKKFDLIICNHVIEHLAAPRETIELLLNHLSDTGLLFVEVPMELWKYPPLLTQNNPITHVNFFSPGSLKNLMIASGASVIKCELAEYLHTSSNWNPGLRCIVRRKTSVTKADNLVKPDSLDFLNPNLKTYFRYYSGNRRKFRSEILRRIC